MMRQVTHFLRYLCQMGTHESMRFDKLREKMMDFTIMAEGLAFPEGPVMMDDGSVIVVEIAAGLAAVRRRHLETTEAAVLDLVPVAGGERGEGEGEEEGGEGGVLQATHARR